MATSRTASVEYEKRRQEHEQAAVDQRRQLRALRRAADERATAQYYADRAADAARLTRELDDRVAELTGLLARGLRRPARVDLAALRRAAVLPPLDLTSVGWAPVPPDPARFTPPAPPGLSRLAGGGARHRRAVAEAQEAYDRAVAEHERAAAARQRRFDEARQRHRDQVTAARREVEDHNRAVDEFAAAVADREPVAVGHHLELVLDAVPLPRYFPRGAAVDRSADRPAVRVELPGPEVVPTAVGVRYDRDADELHVQPRSHEDAAELYRLVLGQVVLLCLRDAFDADPGLAAVALSGAVRGRCLVSVQVERAAFAELDLRSASLDQLRALVSTHPYDLEPIAG